MVNFSLSLKRKIQTALTLIVMGWAMPAFSAPTHILINVEGNVQVKKSKWKDFNKIEPGITLNSKDKIKVIDNASATIYCSDKTRWIIDKPGIHSISDGCSEGSKIALINQGNNQSTRGAKAPAFEESLEKLPYLVSPRKTYVLNAPLTIRWNEVPGATNYKVKVEDWERETKEGQISYDGKLEPGEYYSITIVANNGATSQDEYGRLESGDNWFIVLEDEKAETLREEFREKLEALKEAEKTQEEKEWSLAMFYLDKTLYFDVIQILEGLVKSGSQKLEVYYLLGDMYQKVGLNLMAKDIFQQGLALSVQQENSEYKGSIQQRLEWLESSLGIINKAGELLRR
ncbi:MAG: hypothetical protein O4861_16005 [Trichodesmium sp. St16_bin4-tuft]|nr:hypothetical protein [Trichodesmium sp. St4_bin8_1]MDE5071398.1 hypothetical protein [Trichodesmium sp. St5_bin8]MDE5078467.1 hypothetical protein [Trichodesmium sp. St2_bin6]MDE5092436.1 hypothetical protein [Trichodesmium sp. St18_bin3_1_1]MDE5099751.1 hypothetical protein [Trichodesmium sp. St16_bin4-tuft]MDE5104281.1 hypothetical protein [Trichodesmium sp. St19_bin2]